MNLQTINTQDLLNMLAFIALYLFLFLVSKIIKEIFTPYNMSEELTQNDNFAISLTLSGYYLGIVAIFVGSLLGPEKTLLKDLVSVSSYAVLGFLALNISRFITDKIILRKFSAIEHLTKEKNIAIGLFQFGAYIATGLIFASSIAGDSGNIFTALGFFIMGQISLLLFVFVYDFITPYSIHKEIEKKNIAAGIGISGNLIAFGIIIANGIYGEFIGWTDGIISMVLLNIFAFIFLPIIRIFVDKLILLKADLNKEIIEDQNIAAGFLEAVIAFSSAIVLVTIL